MTRDLRWQAMAELDERRVEERAQRKFTDLMASAGITQDRMATELLYFLPRDFVDAYSNLFHDIFQLDAGANARGQRLVKDAELARTKGSAKTNGKRHKKHWVITNPKAFATKEKVDKKLRKIAREMRASQEDKQSQLTCSNCKKYMEEDWTYCARCGEAAPDAKAGDMPNNGSTGSGSGSKRKQKR